MSKVFAVNPAGLGSLVNAVMRQSNDPTLVPEVGMGATILMWTDRHAATVTHVSSSKKTIQVTTDKARRTDGNGMSEVQSWEYTPDPDGVVHTYTLRQNGRWVLRGEDMFKGRGLLLGGRDEYHDFSF